MLKELLFTTTIIGSLCMPILSHAADRTTTDTKVTEEDTDLPKDTWLNTITPLVPDLLCKGFIQDPDLKKRFDEIKMSYEQCVTLIPASTTLCQNKLYASMPDKMNNSVMSTWGKSMGECIGRDFSEKYLLPKS